MNKEQQKRVAAIHDLSGFGKCSLTVALPILSAAGIETSALPTAILSTHTGGILGYTYRDLTEDMRPFMKHWKELDIRFRRRLQRLSWIFRAIRYRKRVLLPFQAGR